MPRPSHAEIARCAARLWEKRGRPNNRDEEIWLEAEQLLMIAQNHSRPKDARPAQPKSAAKGGSDSPPRLKFAGISSRTVTNLISSVV
jgi:hypothetical protein